jgi:HK97 family phage prohead protease
MIKKICEAAEFKLLEDGSGSFSGYGSTFSNRDRVGDVIAKGAFTKSLTAFVENGCVPVGHQWDELPVATISEAYEDAKGLFIRADFHSTPEAQAARTVVRERLERGKSVGLSIGFEIKDSERTKDGRLLTEIELLEVSLVTIPCNPLAQATDAKSVCGASGLPLASRDREWDAAAAEKGVRSWAGAEEKPNGKYRRAFMICDGPEEEFTSYKFPFAAVDGGELKAVPRGIFAVAAVLQGSRGGARLSDEDRAGAKAKVASYYARMRKEFGDDSIVVPWADESGKGYGMVANDPGDTDWMAHDMTMAAMQEAHHHLMGHVADGLYNGLGSTEVAPHFDDHKGACLGVYKCLMGKSAEERQRAAKAVAQILASELPPAGFSLVTQLDAALAAVESCIDRLQAVKELRDREGRSLSQERRAHLAELIAKAQELHEATRPKVDEARLLRLKAAHLARVARARAASLPG